MRLSSISDNEFTLFTRFIYEAAGITMAQSKKALVRGQIVKRLRNCGLKTHGECEYFRALASGQTPAPTRSALS